MFVLFCYTKEKTNATEDWGALTDISSVLQQIWGVLENVVFILKNANINQIGAAR